MPIKLFADLVNRLAPTVPGCPQPVMLNYLRDAAIESCERTLSWRYEQPGIVLTAGVVDYPYEIPTDTEVHAIITASVNGADIRSVTLENVHRRWPKYPDNAVDQRTTPQAVVHIDPDTFYVAPPPDGGTTYVVDMFVALKPLRSATGMDQTIMDDLENVILHGASQNLLVLPERTWSDRELAAFHAKQFSFKLAERRARTNVGAGRAVLNVAAHPLA